MEFNNKRVGRRMTLHMMAVERELYMNSSMSSNQLMRVLRRCEEYGESDRPKSVRTLQKVIKKMRELYLEEYGIDEKESIAVSRSGALPKYSLGKSARQHLLFPENIFYEKTDKEKMNLLLKVGDYFSLPKEVFIGNNQELTKGSREIFGSHIELREAPYDGKVFADIFDAVENNRVITFRYESMTPAKDAAKNEHPVVTPYYLKSYNNKWYLLGHVRKSASRWTVFALDRIADVEVCQDVRPYELDTKAIESFYANVIGFFVPPNPDGSFPQSEKELDIKAITLTLKGDKAAYFLKKNPIHGSQRQSKENKLQFTLKCLDNLHLYQALLRILDDIRWIDPPIVRNRLLAKLEEGTKTLKANVFFAENQ